MVVEICTDKHACCLAVIDYVLVMLLGSLVMGKCALNFMNVQPKPSAAHGLCSPGLTCMGLTQLNSEPRAPFLKDIPIG